MTRRKTKKRAPKRYRVFYKGLELKDLPTEDKLLVSFQFVTEILRQHENKLNALVPAVLEQLEKARK
jgi:hypothetical protein